MSVERHSDNISAHLFHQGINYSSYEYLGVHKKNNRCFFRVWAPRAERVFLVGDFCDWKYGISMERVTEGGIWEISVPSDTVSDGNKYKYKIFGNGQVHYKSDPYAVVCECPPATASVIYNEENPYTWKDDGWLKYRRRSAADIYKRPLNIYEVNLGSWKRKKSGEFVSYSELAVELIPYVKQMGFTHIAVMPIMEYFDDLSGGYLTTSYYAPTARLGSPKGFKSFVDSMHEAGVGVLLDWNCASFSQVEHGLARFDGCAVYEKSDQFKLNIGCNEVESFLISNAVYWLKEYHIDGIRVSDLDLHIPLDSELGVETISFFRKLNSHIKAAFFDVLMIAGVSDQRVKITSFDNNGLGFDMAWNTNWSKNVLEYAKSDPLFRKHFHSNVSDDTCVDNRNRYILPFSHCIELCEDKSLLNCMSGDYWQKFASVRAFIGYMMTFPGKKLNFMGNEIGQFDKWDPQKETEWFLLDHELHSRLQYYVSELNNFYLEHSSLWQCDFITNGFEWIDRENNNLSIISYIRRNEAGKELLIIINFTPLVHEGFVQIVNSAGVYSEIFNSDDIKFGGSGVVNCEGIKADNISNGDGKYGVKLRVPPLGIVVLERE